MLDGMTRLLPMASVGFVGMVRDEESLVASTYANRLPARLDGREVFVLDPMLATGGTLVTVISMLRTAALRRSRRSACSPRLRGSRGSTRPSPATPCGSSPARSTSLNDKGYIVPGLGDAGDRLFGEIEQQFRTVGAVPRRPVHAASRATPATAGANAFLSVALCSGVSMPEAGDSSELR